MFCVAGVPPAGEVLFFREKDPKPLTPRLALLKRRDANFRRADQLAPLEQGPPSDESVPPLGQRAGVGRKKTNVQQMCAHGIGPVINTLDKFRCLFEVVQLD